MKSQFGTTFTVERKPFADNAPYILMAWTGGSYLTSEDACFDPDKARELGQALIDAADDVKRCRCGRTV